MNKDKLKKELQQGVTMNRLGNVTNRYQRQFRKVLCLCSAGLLRSPTMALVLSQEPFNFNTRAAGIDRDFALINVDQILLEWCDEVACANDEIKDLCLEMMGSLEITGKQVHSFDLQDSFCYRDPELCRLIYTKALAIWKQNNENGNSNVES